jgi:hypothetical protein
MYDESHFAPREMPSIDELPSVMDNPLETAEAATGELSATINEIASKLKESQVEVWLEKLIYSSDTVKHTVSELVSELKESRKKENRERPEAQTQDSQTVIGDELAGTISEIATHAKQNYHTALPAGPIPLMPCKYFTRRHFKQHLGIDSENIFFQVCSELLFPLAVARSGSANRQRVRNRRQENTY